jgi:hypothetical protein
MAQMFTHRSKGWLFAILGLVFLVGAAGCTTAPTTKELTEEIEPSGCTISQDGAPEFYGPWQGDIEHAYNSSVTSERAKQILCSGGITAEHVAELNEALKSCLTDAGFSNIAIDGYGLLSITSPKGMAENTVNSLEQSCEETSGWYPVVSLYGNMRQNPNKANVNQLIAECLVRVGLEPEGFSGEDVAAEYQDGGDAFADISASPLFMPCWYDPLHTE